MKLFSPLTASFVSLICILLLASNVMGASPASPKAVTIEPFLQHVSFGANQAQKKITIKVTNHSSGNFVFKPVAVDFGSLDETGGILFAGTNAPALVKKYGLAKWLVLDDTPLSLAPGASISVPATIDNRSDLSPGGHYAAIVLASASLNKGSQTLPKISFQQNISSLIFAVKTGGEKYDLHLSNINHNGSFFRLPSQVKLRFYNPGNVQVIPRGRVLLMQGNKVISQGAINESSSYVLPETYRQLSVELRHVNYKPFNPFVNYTLLVDYRYDGINQMASKNLNIRYFNLPVFLLGLIFILFVGFGSRWAWLNYKSWR